MEDETIVPVNEDEELEALTNETVDEEATADELKAKLSKERELLKEAIKTKKNWRTKYEEAIKANGKDDSSLKTTPDKPTDDLVKDVQELKIEREKRQFAYSNSLSPEETDFVFSQPVPTGKERKDLLDNPFVKGGLAAVRSENSQASATPRPSGRFPKVEGKTFEEMKPAEREKNWKKFTGAK
jgi:hypothetical protein